MSEQADSNATTDGELAHDAEKESSEIQKDSVATDTPRVEDDTSSEQAKVLLQFYIGTRIRTVDYIQ